MKYIYADKLIAEIERRMKDYNVSIEKYYNKQNSIKAERDSWKWAECKWFLSLIVSLQQEQPDNEDIDKVAQELYEHLYELKRRNNVPTNLYDKQEIIDLWKAGIEYGRNHPKQEQLEVDLEEEMTAYIGSHFHIRYDETLEVGNDPLTTADFEEIARHFYSLGLNARKE